MEMKDIDLTKCVNCRFRAKDNGKEVEGRIAVDGDYLRFFYSNGDIYSILISCYQEHGIDYFDDLEIVPRDPEAYRDWQVGDTIEYSDNYSTGRIIFRGGDFVAADIEGTCNCYTCDELFNEGYRLVLTDIEQQIIEERKKTELNPQDGDVCFVEASDGYCSIFIYKNGFHRTNYYASLDTDKGCSTILFTDGGHVVANSKITVLRPATEEERQKLFDAMAKGGKRWNAEKKVVEDIPKPYEFRYGEPVLVRNGACENWGIASYCRSEGTMDKVYVGSLTAFFEECIPYNEKTMHLLGTAEDYKEEQAI